MPHAERDEIKISLLQISAQLSLNANTAMAFVTSTIPFPLQGDSTSTVITVSVDYPEMRRPTQNFVVSLEERLSSLRLSQSIGGFAVVANASFGHQGLYLSGTCLSDIFLLYPSTLHNVSVLSLTTNSTDDHFHVSNCDVGDHYLMYRFLFLSSW